MARSQAGFGVRSTMVSRELERFSETVEAIYAASLNPGLWQNAVRAIATQHSAPMANLLTPLRRPDDGGFIFSVGIRESGLQLWGSKYASHDIWAHRVLERDLAHEGNIAISEDLVTEEEFEQSVFYREFLQHQDIWHICTGIVFDGSKLPLTAISLFRPRRGNSFEDLDRRLYKLIVNHLSRSLGTMLMLRDSELRVQASLASLNRFAFAVALMGVRGNIIFLNDCARRMIGEGDGLSIRRGNPLVDGEGWLIAKDVTQNARLARCVKSCVDPAAEPQHFNQAVAISRPSGKRDYVAHASSLASSNEICGRRGDAGAIVFITDPDSAPRVSLALLRRVYGLTPAEAKLCRELISGDGLSAAANRLRISENTAKTQLTAVYEKTRTHRQAELVKLLLGLASHEMDSLTPFPLDERC